MNIQKNTLFSDQDFSAFLILPVALYLLYFSPLHIVYYFADETHFLTEQWSFTSNLNRIVVGTLRFGRPINLLTFGLISSIVISCENGLQIIRVLQFIASCGTAMLLFYLLRKRQVSAPWACFIVLLIWSQPVMQIYQVYSIVATFLLGTCCSYIAFYIVCCGETDKQRFSLYRVFIAMSLLMIGWLSFQATPFCGLAPMSFYVLTATKDEWSKERRKYIIFLVTLISSMLLYIVGYKILLSLANWHNVYDLTNRSFSILSGMPLQEYLTLLNPKNYLGPFEWWNYIYPLKKLSETTFQFLSFLTILIWLTVLYLSFMIERKQSKNTYVIQKYAIAIFSVALTFLPLIADGFTFRQHLYIACVPALILIGAHCTASVVRYQYQHVIPKYINVAAIVLLGFVSLGAQADVYRDLVLPNAKFFSFVQTEILRQSNKDYDRVIVINAPQLCLREPCRGFMGRRMSVADRKDFFSKQFYQRRLQEIGENIDVPIEYSEKINKDLDLSRIILIDNRILYESLTK